MTKHLRKLHSKHRIHDMFLLNITVIMEIIVVLHILSTVSCSYLTKIYFHAMINCDL